jgi:hypothetical protein
VALVGTSDSDRTYISFREIVEQIAEFAFEQAPSGRPIMTTQSHRMRMLTHLSRQHLMDQLVRSVEQCEYERRARERVKRVVRWNEDPKVVTQKTEDDWDRP